MKMILCLVIGFFLFTSCSSPTASVAADPDGTILANLSTTADWAIWEGLASTSYYLPSTGTMSYMIIGIDMTPTLNTHFDITYCADLSNPNGENFYGTGGEVATVGLVTGLGSVTTKPSSGYAAACAVEKNYGYVIRYRKSYNQADTTLPYFYARFYVIDWLTSSTTGGIIGATIKFQGPF